MGGSRKPAGQDTLKSKGQAKGEAAAAKGLEKEKAAAAKGAEQEDVKVGEGGCPGRSFLCFDLSVECLSLSPSCSMEGLGLSAIGSAL